MLTIYPKLESLEAKRQGEAWVSCDTANCDAEAKVDGGMPKGWVTTDPDGDPLQGASQYCPKHASKVPGPSQPSAE